MIGSSRAASDLDPSEEFRFPFSSWVKFCCWRKGKFAFDGGTLPRTTKPFASSLMATLFPCVHDAYDEEELVAHLDEFKKMMLLPSDDFEKEVNALELDQSLTMAALRVADGWRLNDLLEASPSIRRELLALTFLLLELNTLKAE